MIHIGRERMARFLIDRLFGSFLISAFIVWSPVLGIRLENLGFQGVYTTAVVCSLVAFLIFYLLIPKR